MNTKSVFYWKNSPIIIFVIYDFSLERSNSWEHSAYWKAVKTAIFSSKRKMTLSHFETFSDWPLRKISAVIWAFCPKSSEILTPAMKICKPSIHIIRIHRTQKVYENDDV